MNTQPEHNAELSIIIVNYHAWDKLKNCLKSLSPAHQPGLKLDIIVVDNDPDDPKLSEFVSDYPDVRFIKNEGNYGFAHGCNTGALLATSPVFLFLNPDTVAPDGVLREMLTSFATLDEHSILGTNKTNRQGKPERIQRFFGTFGMQSGIGKALHRLLKKQAINERFSADKAIVYPDWISGSVVMISRETFYQIHGWDTRFWMYSEDADLCKRVHLLGGKVALNQTLNIMHDHGGSSRINEAISALTKSEVKISHHVYVSKHFTGLHRLLMHTELIVLDTISTTFYMLISLIFFTSSKLKTKRYLWFNLISYYRHCLASGQWLSPRSVGIDNRL